jgi:hypothetical protein
VSPVWPQLREGSPSQAASICLRSSLGRNTGRSNPQASVGGRAENTSPPGDHGLKVPIGRKGFTHPSPLTSPRDGVSAVSPGVLTRSAASGSPASRCTQPTLKHILAGGSRTPEKRHSAPSQSPRATACTPWCQSRTWSPTERMEARMPDRDGSRRLGSGLGERGAAAGKGPTVTWGTADLAQGFAARTAAWGSGAPERRRVKARAADAGCSVRLVSPAAAQRIPVRGPAPHNHALPHRPRPVPRFSDSATPPFSSPRPPPSSSTPGHAPSPPGAPHAPSASQATPIAVRPRPRSFRGGAL